MATQSEKTDIALIKNDIGYIKEKINSVDYKVSSNYVTKDEYHGTIRRVKLLEKIVYGAVALIVIAVFGALISTVVNK